MRAASPSSFPRDSKISKKCTRKSRPLQVAYFSRLLGIAPFNFASKGSSVVVCHSMKWTLYSYGVNLFLFAALFITGEFCYSYTIELARPALLILSRGYSIWLCHVYCLLNGHKICLAILNVYNLNNPKKRSVFELLILNVAQWVIIVGVFVGNLQFLNLRTTAGSIAFQIVTSLPFTILLYQHHCCFFVI